VARFDFFCLLTETMVSANVRKTWWRSETTVVVPNHTGRRPASNSCIAEVFSRQRRSGLCDFDTKSKLAQNGKLVLMTFRS
jgi:hypothetical protein